MKNFCIASNPARVFALLGKLTVWAYRSIPVMAGAAMLLMAFSAAAPPESLFQLSASASTNLRSSTIVTVQAKLRSEPFTVAGSASAKGELMPVEIIRHEMPSLDWAIGMPGSAAISSGSKCTLYTRTADGTTSSSVMASSSFPQFGFISYFLWGRDLLELEETVARSRNIPISIKHVPQNNGADKVLVKISPAPGATDEVSPVELTWFDRRLCKEYVFNGETYRMESAKVTLVEGCQETVIFETGSIMYSEPEDGSQASL